MCGQYWICVQSFFFYYILRNLENLFYFFFFVQNEQILGHFRAVFLLFSYSFLCENNNGMQFIAR